MFLWQTSCSRVITEREKWSAGPVLRFTSPHILNSLIFPLDTAKNHRLNSIEHQYYRQRHFMQLTAAYLSHSLLTSLLICGGGGEGGGWMTEGREEWRGRKTDTEEEREGAPSAREERRREVKAVTWHKEVKDGPRPNLLTGSEGRLARETFLFWHHSQEETGERNCGKNVLLCVILMTCS